MPGMQPLQFNPILKRIRWGGRRLGTVLGNPLGEGCDWAESWEIADHASGRSVVAQGDFAGRDLQWLVTHCGEELLGRHAPRAQFPLLIKFLDAHDRLSVQVHPNDEQARRFDPAEHGKTEAWVILHADPGSRLYAGLKPGVTREDLAHAIAEGRVEECLHSFTVRAGDAVFLPAGTVHAIGEGILLAEVQQMSDLTFRMFDWNRTGSDGEPRPLHIEEALLCTDFTRGPVDAVQPRTLDAADHRVEELVDCAHFVLRRHVLDGPAVFRNDHRFRICMNIGGDGELLAEGGQQRMPLGTTVLIPAAVTEWEFHPAGSATLLEAFLP